ncbi:MAG: four-carbon acid sugar kinase family protein [Candidatus Rokuibacteriota bacterium]
MKVGIQADDLTGACDTGAPFAARGLETVVLLPEAPIPALPRGVVVFDTESRALPAAEARARACLAATRLAGFDPPVLYKKVDSTLRGSVAPEIAGALEGAGLPSAVLAPAFPAQRRVVVDGVMHIDRRPADESPIARDPGFPATGASVLALAGVAGPRPVALVPLATVRRGPDAVAARLRRGVALVVCDAETDQDLAVLAAATVEPPALRAGSAGFATAIAARIGTGRGQSAARPRRPILVVAGSAHPSTRAQIARLRACGVRSLHLGHDEAAGGLPPVADGDCVLTTDTDLADRPRHGREVVASQLAQVTRHVLAGTPSAEAPVVRYRSLLMTGGDTAFAVCRALGATGIRLGGELEAGLPYGTLLDGPFTGLAVITKAGGFGDPETLVRVVEACA